jgi:hypothetical protein
MDFQDGLIAEIENYLNRLNNDKWTQKAMMYTFLSSNWEVYIYKTDCGKDLNERKLIETFRLNLRSMLYTFRNYRRYKIDKDFNITLYNGRSNLIIKCIYKEYYCDGDIEDNLERLRSIYIENQEYLSQYYDLNRIYFYLPK